MLAWERSLIDNIIMDSVHGGGCLNLNHSHDILRVCVVNRIRLDHDMSHVASQVCKWSHITYSL